MDTGDQEATLIAIIGVNQAPKDLTILIDFL